MYAALVSQWLVLIINMSVRIACAQYAAPIGLPHAKFKLGAKYIMLNTCTRV